MIFSKSKTDYKLDPAGIDLMSDHLVKWIKESGYSRENAIQIRLTMEELLLRIMDHYSDEITVTVVSYSRFGTSRLRFQYRGDSFDPIKASDSPTDDMIRTMMSQLGMIPVWSYRSGVNTLTLHGPKRTLKSDSLLLFSVVLAVGLSLLRYVLPADTVTFLSRSVFAEIGDLFMDAMNTFIGVMIFLSLVSGICSIGSIAEFSRMGKHVISRLLLESFKYIALCSIVILPFFHLAYGTVLGGTSQAGAVAQLVLSIVPTNPVTPFAERNLLQIIFMAVFVGAAMLVLEDSVSAVRTLVTQASTLMMQVINTICRLLPLYIFVSLSSVLWEQGFSMFVRLWKPLVFYIVFGILYMIADLVLTGFRMHVSPMDLLSRMQETMLTGFLTASSSAAFTRILHINEKKFGIESKLSMFTLPLSNMMLASDAGAGIVVMLYYFSEVYKVPVSPSWIITAVLMSTIISMTLPPVSGGMLVCTGMLFTQLNIPSKALALAGILLIVYDFIMTGLKIGHSHLLILRAADHLGMLDRDTLEHPE